MKVQGSFRIVALAFALNVMLSASALGTTASGTVTDASGNPVAGASVLVYSAGVRTGYSVFCPTCYADCGKRATTDERGRFSIAGLDDELVFNVIAVHKGFVPAWIRKLDPQKGTAPPLTLKARAAADPAHTVMGRIVDGHGQPVPDALVEVHSLIDTRGAQAFGNYPDGLAISGSDGSFELGPVSPHMADWPPAIAMLLEVEPRGMAPVLYTASVGPRRQLISVGDGATIHGRLLFKGKPVPGAQLELLTLNRSSDNTYSPIYIGTDEKGRFAITNVPVGRVWSLNANSDSLAGIGTVATRYVATHTDSEIVDVGDMEVKPGYTLSGRIVLTDGKPIAPGMRVGLGTATGGERVVMLGAGGRFEFKGVAGPYLVVPAVRGYRLPQGYAVEALIERNISDLVITLKPAPAPTAKRPAP